jgi:uncharacterized membrane protein YfcA
MSSSPADFGLIAAGAFLAALVIGSAGFAFAIVVTGFWIHVLPPPALVLLAAICATLLHATSIWRFRREIEYGLLWPFLVGTVLGVPLGVAALGHVDAMLFRRLFGAFMIAYSVYMLARPRLYVVRLGATSARAADAAVGWVSGVLGGLAMLQGTLTTIWCGMRGWDKRRSRCVYQPHIGFTALLIMAVAGLQVEVDPTLFAGYLVVCLPALALGLWLGLRVFDWISEERFRRLLLWLILGSGITLQL